MPTPLTFVAVEARTDALALLPALLPWVHAAGNPYYDWLLGTPDRAREVIAGWMARPTSEISVTGVTALYHGGDLAGGFVAWPAEEIGARRWADAQALFKAFTGPERDALRGRLAAAAHLFLPPEPGTYYLSKVGVLAEHRGTGHGLRLVERYLEEGAELGFRAFTLDVAAENAGAIHLYERLGFAPTASRTTSDGRLTYLRFLKGRPG